MVSDTFFTQVQRSRSRCMANGCIINPIYFSFAFAASLPVLAATLAFVTYTLTAHNFNVAIIFSSFNLFQVRFVPSAHLVDGQLNRRADSPATHDVHASCSIGYPRRIQRDQATDARIPSRPYFWRNTCYRQGSRARAHGGGRDV